MTKNGRFQTFFPVIFSFYIIGFVDLVGVATGYVKTDFDLSDTVAQFLPSMVFIWFALLSIPTGILQDRVGKKRTVILGMLLTAVGLMIPFLSYSYWTVLMGFGFLGMGNTVLQVSANPLLIQISHPRDESANLSLSQFVKACASLLGPVIIALLVDSFGNWRLVFPVYAFLTLCAAGWLSGIRIMEKKPIRSPATLYSVLSLLRDKWVRIMIIAMALIVGFDVGINSNIVRFLTARFDLNMETAGYGISLYFASLMAGRLTGALVLRKVNERTFLIGSLLLCLASLFGLVFIDNLMVNWVLIFTAGLGFSNIFPQLFSMILRIRPEHANELSGLIILSVSGGALIPPVMGLLSDIFNHTWIIFVLISCMIYVGVSSISLLKEIKSWNNDDDTHSNHTNP